MAHLPGLELGTFRLGGERSILLSYRCKKYIYSIFMNPMHFRIRTAYHLGGERSILLSYRCIKILIQFYPALRNLRKAAVSWRGIRTPANKLQRLF